jgi:hypothetical protein
MTKKEDKHYCDYCDDVIENDMIRVYSMIFDPKDILYKDKEFCSKECLKKFVNEHIN